MHRALSRKAVFLAATLFANGAAGQESFDWTGFYIGANAGYAWGDDQTVENVTQFLVAVPDIPGVALEGPFAGAQVGYLSQWGRLVFGLEGDIQVADIEDREGTGTIDTAIGPIAFSALHGIEWFGTFRGRAGWAFDRWLPYITGGVAFGHVDLQHITDWTFAPGQLTTVVLDDDGLRAGFSAGGGVELAISDLWSIKLEYQHVDLGTGSASGFVAFPPQPNLGGNIITNNVEAQIDTVRIGGNFRF